MGTQLVLFLEVVATYITGEASFLHVMDFYVSLQVLTICIDFHAFWTAEKHRNKCVTRI